MPIPIIIPPRGPPPGRPPPGPGAAGGGAPPGWPAPERGPLMRPPPIGELREHDLAIGVVRIEQLAMRADADDPTAIEDDDPIGAHDRGDALGDDDHRGVTQLLGERGAESGIGRHVERREAVVEDDDVRPSDDGPGDGRRWR